MRDLQVILKKAPTKISDERRIYAVKKGEKSILPTMENKESGSPHAIKIGSDIRVTNS